VVSFCPAFLQCDEVCSGCLTYQEEWYNCAAGGDSCTIDCLGDGDQIVNRLLAERNDCDREQTALQQCLDEELDIASAYQCLHCMKLASGEEGNHVRDLCSVDKDTVVADLAHCESCGVCQSLMEAATFCELNSVACA